MLEKPSPPAERQT